MKEETTKKKRYYNTLESISCGSFFFFFFHFYSFFTSILFFRSVFPSLIILLFYENVGFVLRSFNRLEMIPALSRHLTAPSAP